MNGEKRSIATVFTIVTLSHVELLEGNTSADPRQNKYIHVRKVVESVERVLAREDLPYRKCFFPLEPGESVQDRVVKELLKAVPVLALTSSPPESWGFRLTESGWWASAFGLKIVKGPF